MNRIFAIFLFFLLIPAAVFAIEDYQKERETRRWLTKKPIIDKIEIEGNSYFDNARIKKHLFSRVGNIFRSIKKDRRHRIQRETMMRDTSEIKYLYLTNGFLNIAVTEQYVKVEENDHAIIKINISEGNQYYYGKFSIEGNYASKFNHRINRIVGKLKLKDPANPFRLQQAAYDIKSVLANNGYPYAHLNFIIDTTFGENQIAVTYIIESDSLVHFGDVEIIGSEKYDTSLVNRELTMKKGAVYRRKDIIESQKRLFGSGYFLTLRLESQKPDTLEPLKRLNPDFILNLREKNPHYVSIKTGAEQDSIKDLIWSLGASWGKRNFLKSRTIEFSARTAFVIFSDWRLLKQNYRVSIADPWFLGIKMPLTLSGQIEPGLPAPVHPYKKRSWSISATTSHKSGDRWTLFTGLKYEKLKIYDIDTTEYENSDAAIELIKEAEGISARRKFYLSIIRDSRNSIFLPTRGSHTTVNIEYVGGFLGGDASFYHFESSWARYQRVWPGWITATRIMGGFVQEMKQSDAVPIEDRFYIGGANTIRGFDEQQLGPLDGSDIILVFNQEFRFPILGKFWGSIFGDVGNGFRFSDQIKWDNLTVSYGIGIQFISPAGPIRLDYAQRARIRRIAPFRDEVGEGGKIHFTILYAF